MWPSPLDERNKRGSGGVGGLKCRSSWRQREEGQSEDMTVGEQDKQALWAVAHSVACLPPRAAASDASGCVVEAVGRPLRLALGSNALHNLTLGTAQL